MLNITHHKKHCRHKNLLYGHRLWSFDDDVNEKMDVEDECNFDQFRIGSEEHKYIAADNLKDELLSETSTTKLQGHTPQIRYLIQGCASPNWTLFGGHGNIAAIGTDTFHSRFKLFPAHPTIDRGRAPAA